MDEKIDKINKKISKILGKKTNHKHNFHNHDSDTIGDWLYLVITFICIVFLWLSTGVYYLGEGYCGIITKYGEIQKIVSGPRAGFALPLPIGSILILDNIRSNGRKISLINDGEEMYQDISMDDVPFKIDGEYSALISNPEKLYNTVYLTRDNINNTIRLYIINELHKYTSHVTYSSLKATNLTLLSNQIKQNVNNKLSLFGLLVTKINLISILDNKPIINLTPQINPIHNEVVDRDVIRDRFAERE